MNIGVVSILYPTRRYPTRGIFVKDALERLSARCNLKCLSPLPFHEASGESLRFTADAGYPVRRPRAIPFPSWFMQQWYATSLAYTLKMGGRRFFADRDLVHVHYAFPDVPATVTAFGDRHPIVATIHGSDMNIIARRPGPRKRIVEGLNACATVICVSGSLADRCREIGVTAPLVVIPNGVDTTLFSPGDKQAARKIVGFDHDGPLILFAGNFVPVKGIDYLILSLAGVLAEFPAGRLVLIGGGREGKSARSYQELADRDGVGGSLTFLPNLPHEALRNWMRAADLLVLPSLAEGFGLVAAESLACGRPVVATRCGGPEDIVVDGAGRLVKVADPEALAEAVCGVLRGEGIDPPEKLAASVAARFSWDAVTDRIMEVYDNARGASSRAAGGGYR